MAKRPVRQKAFLGKFIKKAIRTVAKKKPVKSPVPTGVVKRAKTVVASAPKKTSGLAPGIGLGAAFRAARRRKKRNLANRAVPVRVIATAIQEATPPVKKKRGFFGSKPALAKLAQMEIENESKNKAQKRAAKVAGKIASGVLKMNEGGSAVRDATSNRATNAGVSRGAGIALRGTKFRGVK